MILGNIPKQNTPVMDAESPALMSKPWWVALANISVALKNRVTYGVWADIPGAAGVQEGSLYVATDRGNAVYQLQNVVVAPATVPTPLWVLVEGTVRVAQSGIAALVATLNANDAGLLLVVTDYRHVLRWDGAALGWGPGEDGRHDIVGLPVDPDDTTGWQLCDGTTVAYLKGDGTTDNYATPDLTSAANKAAYLKLGSPVSGPNAAVAPTVSIGAYTPAGTVSQPTFTGTPGTTTAASAGAQGSGATGNTLTQAAHTHNFTPAGTVSQPTFTGTPASPTGTAGTNGEPRNMELRPWFRR